jgi:predicted dehydrogenase
MRKSLRFGIIGCSSIADRITIPSMVESKFSRLENIGSRSTIKAKKFSEKFNSESYGNYEDVLNDRNTDAVYISLPIGLQEKWIIKAANAQKHILCEKSISTSLKSIKKIISVCKKNDVSVMEGFSYRFHPQQKEVERILNQKKIGVIRNFSSYFLLPILPSVNNFRFNKKLGGGILNDVCCYIINASRLIMKDEPISVTCKLFKNKKFNIDNNGIIYMVFPDNRTAVGVFGYEKMYLTECRIFGSKGFVNIDNYYNINKTSKAKIDIITRRKTTMKINSVNKSKLMIEYFCKKIFDSNHTNSMNEIIKQGIAMEASRISNLKEKTVFLSDLR